MLAVSCLLFLTGCKKKETRAVVEKKINVQVQAAEKKKLRPSVDAVGTLNPSEEVIVSAEVDGIVKSVMVDEGLPVSQGMLLAVIDDTDYGLDLKRAEASLKQTEATLENTKLEYNRKNALYKEELVTRQQFDDISARLSIAGADVDKARSTLMLSRQRLSKTRINSPLRGYVSEKKVSSGDYARNGMQLFKIIRTAVLKLSFTVTEKEAGMIRIGQDVLFRVDAFPDVEFAGKVRIVYPNMEEKTRTLKIEAAVPNDGGRLKPGLFANVTLYTSNPKNMVVVPVTALLYEGEKVRIFIAEGDTAKERVVKTGQKYTLKTEAGSKVTGIQEYTEIIEGVKEGEKVVTLGQQNLSDGVKINVAR